MLAPSEAGKAFVYGVFEGAGRHVVHAAESLIRLREEYEVLLGKYQLLQKGMSQLVSATVCVPMEGTGAEEVLS